MKTRKPSRLWPGLALLTAAVLAVGFAPAARADHLVPRSPAVVTTAGVPVVLAAVAGQPGQQFQPQDESPRPDAGAEGDWEDALRHLQPGDEAALRELFVRASVLAQTAVVISYNPAPTTTPVVTPVITPVVTPPPVVSPYTQTWQWQSWCWSPQGPPVVPPPPQAPPVSSVPEPASLMSALIGAGVTGFCAWRRNRLRRAAR